MADIKKPFKKKTTKGNPPPESKPSNNLLKKDKEQEVALNFKVSYKFRKEFKTYALEQDLHMVDLLKECFFIKKARNNY